MDDELKKHVERTRRVNIGQEVKKAIICFTGLHLYWFLLLLLPRSCSCFYPQVLEAKMKVKEQECEIEREAASRVTSLNPAASFYIRRSNRVVEEGQLPG